MSAEITPFLVLNHRLDDARFLREMIRDIAAKGSDGVFLHAREGLLTPYLSEAWFEAIGVCVDEAKRCGIKAWVYDEFPYPSGVGGGKVVKSDPRFTEHHLRVRRHALRGGRRVRLVLGEDPVLHAFLSPLRGGKPDFRAAREVTRKIGPANETWIMREWDSRWYYSPKHARVYDCPRSSALRPEEVFEAVLSPGRWELTVFHVRTGGDFKEPFGNYVDVSNLEATKRFLEVTHEEYKRRFGREFGRTVPGVFTDEPKYRNLLPWSESLAAGWVDYRKDARALLALADADPAKDEVRSRYRETAFRLFRDHWIRPNAAWCARNGLKFTGHISPEEEWFTEAMCCGSIAQLLKEFHIPGCDLIIPAVGDRDHPILNLTPSLAVSVAAQQGRAQALCELYGCSDFSITLQGMKRIADWLAIFGINVFTPHGLFGWLDGYRKYDAGPSFYRPNTLWPHYKAWAENLRATANRLGPRGVRAEAVLVRPIRALWRLGVEGRPAIERMVERAMTLAQNLLERGLMIHWMDDLDLAGAGVRGGKIRVGSAAYAALLYLDGTLDPSGLAEIARLRRAGGRVLADVQAGRLEGPLRSRRGAIRTVHARDGGWFCVNLRPTREKFTLAGREHELEGYESRWLPRSGTPAPARRVLEILRLSGSWSLTPTKDNLLVLDRWTLCGKTVRPAPYYDHAPPAEVGAREPIALGSIPSNPDLPRMKRLIYRTRFRVEGACAAALVLEGETIRGRWTASLNGRKLARWRKSRRYEPTNLEHDLRGRLRQGVNTLEFDIRISKSSEGFLDPCRFFGRFRVKTGRGLPALLPAAPLSGVGDWTRKGWPHYSGTMIYTQEFVWKSSGRNDRVELVLDRPPKGHVEVFLNRRRAGAMLWSPWRLDVSRALRSGKNRLELRVTNTLQNLIYGRPCPSGLMAGVKLVRTR